MMSEGFVCAFCWGRESNERNSLPLGSNLDCVFMGARLWMGLLNLLMCLDNEITEKRRAMYSISRGPTGN